MAKLRIDYEHMMTAEQHRAEALGLRLEHFNSGLKENSSNGWRIFTGTDRRDYFAGNHIAHYRTGQEIIAWLDCWEAHVADSKAA